jgi:hypothetical protein
MTSTTEGTNTMPIGILTEEEKQVIERGLRIANETIVGTIADYCVIARDDDGRTHFDTRPMLDPREVKPATLDLHAEMLSYGEAVGLLQRHATHRHLVRLVRGTP